MSRSTLAEKYGRFAAGYRAESLSSTRCSSQRARRLYCAQDVYASSPVLPGFGVPDQALKRLLRTVAEFTSEEKLDQAAPPPGREFEVSIEPHQSTAAVHR